MKPQIPRISKILRELSRDERTNLFVAKLQGIDNRSLLYPCNLRHLRFNPLRFFGLRASVLTPGAASRESNETADLFMSHPKKARLSWITRTREIGDFRGFWAPKKGLDGECCEWR